MKFWLALLLVLPLASVGETAIATEPERDRETEPLLMAQTSQPPPAQLNLNNLGGELLVPASGVIAVFVLLVLSLWGYKLVYNITPNNEAFVRTGGLFAKKQTVILNGGCVVLPGFHELTRVPLREISIDVERTDKLAVRTQDYLRANMRVTFYVCISPNVEDVKTAAARLSKGGKISAEDIKDALEKRADDAIRAAAKRKSLAEIDSDKLGFADEVLNLIQQDLKKVGLTLNNIAISEIEESDTYDENNFFDAQGVRLRTETIQRAIQQKREVELTTRVAIEQQELDAQKQSLTIAQEQEEAQLNQTKEIESLTLTQQQEIESLKAQREREVQESKDREAAKIERNKILQDQSVEEENIQQRLTVQQSQIEADIALEEQQKKFQVARALQQQESEVAEITRQQTVDASSLRARIEVALAEQESKTAQQEAAIAIANKERDRFMADAERAQAEAAVQTAQEVEEAEREQRLAVILAQQEAERQRIAEQNVVEIDVFRRRRQAEIARQAADLEAESIRTLAQANRDRELAEAEGKYALLQAENVLNTANRTARLLEQFLPELTAKLPEIVMALAPQPGVLGDARVYAFPGAGGGGSNGNGKASDGIGDINKLLLSTSGLSLLESVLDEGKLSQLIGQVAELLRSDDRQTPTGPPPTSAPEATADEDEPSEPPTVVSIEADSAPVTTPPGPPPPPYVPQSTSEEPPLA